MNSAVIASTLDMDPADIVPRAANDETGGEPQFTTDGVAADKVAGWISSILDNAARFICMPEQVEWQRKVGLWKNSDRIPFPQRAQMVITSNGCLVFDVQVGSSNVHFAVWVTMGEVRIGAKLNTELVMSPIIQRKLSESYDGDKCGRQTDTGKAIMFDWIFRDGFADFHIMLAALRDPMGGAVIARRIGEILTHLYVKILSALSEEYPNSVIVLMNPGTKIKRVRKYVIFSGDIEFFLAFARDRRAVFLQEPCNEPGNSLRIAHIEIDESGGGITRGVFKDVDNGSMISIREIGPLV